MDRTVTIAGVEVPRFLYGTAWKEDATQVLTERAVALGFRGIDTANQRKHYDEAAVRRAISAAIAVGFLTLKSCLCRPNTHSNAGKIIVSPTTPPPPFQLRWKSRLPVRYST